MKLAKLVARWFGGRPSPAEQKLLHACRGDAEQMERLLRFEPARRPLISRADAAQAAIERWNRDR